MPEIALISDIHANIDALKAVLEDIENQGITEIICLGDIVGYGAAPAECLRLVQKRCAAPVIGNHDYYSTQNLNDYELPERVRAGLEFAQMDLSGDEMEWLTTLPFTAQVHGFTIVHASLDRPETFTYIMEDDEEEARQHFKHQETPLCFYGHTHEPILAIEYADKIRWSIPGESDLLLDKTKKSLINVGSVGQPRDGSTRATYGIYEPVDNVFCLRRVSYDIKKAQERIIEARLPYENAVRLEHGW